MKTTKIEWTDKTWNPITGCTKYSEGCRNCYAETMARRLKAMGLAKYSNGFELTMHETSLNEPLKWKASCNIFVCSMSDLFHKDVPFEFVDKVINIIKLTPQHRYQILTKRAERMLEYFQDRAIPKNIWLGVTVENEQAKYRIDLLRQLNPTIRFLSCEPLLEDLGEMNLSNIDWVIVGGESGSSARQMQEEWVALIKKQCEAQGSTFYFKQWGTWGSDGKKRSKKLNGAKFQNAIYQSLPPIPA